MHALGGYTVPGVIVVLLAGAALLLWQYLRLTDSSRLSRSSRTSRYLAHLPVIAVSLTALSVVLIASRFIFMERLF